MSANFLPKSLHTVRILVAVSTDAGALALSPLARIVNAARVIGYADADKRDPLIQKAAAQLAASGK
jgi:hypothetical protein